MKVLKRDGRLQDFDLSKITLTLFILLSFLHIKNFVSMYSSGAGSAPPLKTVLPDLLHPCRPCPLR